MEPVSQLGLEQIIYGVIGIMIAIVVGGILIRILKRAIRGCIATGIGCLVMIVGAVAVGLYFASRANVSSLSDILALLMR